MVRLLILITSIKRIIASYDFSITNLSLIIDLGLCMSQSIQTSQDDKSDNVAEEVSEPDEDRRVLRGGGLHDRIFRIKAMSHGGMPAKIIGIKAKEQFGPVYTETSRNPRCKCLHHGNPLDSRNEAQEKAGWHSTYALSRDTEISVEFELPDGRLSHYKWPASISRWDEGSFLHGIYDHIKKFHEEETFADISHENPIPVVYHPHNDTDDFKLNTSYGGIGTSRTLYDGPSEIPTREDDLKKEWEWAGYKDNREMPGGWVSRPIKKTLEHDDGREAEIIVDVPATEEASFHFEVDEEQSSNFWTLLEELTEDPVELEDEHVYVRPYKLSVEGSQNEYSLGVDEFHEWELAAENPETTQWEELYTEIRSYLRF